MPKFNPPWEGPPIELEPAPTREVTTSRGLEQATRSISRDIIAILAKVDTTLERIPPELREEEPRIVENLEELRKALRRFSPVVKE